MDALFLSPHNDDAVLFGAFTLLRERPRVVTVLRSKMQERHGISHTTREAEDRAAVATILGCRWEQWPFPDDNPDWGAIEAALQRLQGTVSHVYAPAPEPAGGNPHHDVLGLLAESVFAASQVTLYLTYTSAGKSTDGVPVPFEAPWWVDKKLRALACYHSQIATEAAGCTEHFLRDQHEWYQA